MALDEEQVKLIKQTRDLLEELLEMVEVMTDKQLLRDIQVAKREIKQGKAKPFRKLISFYP